eukprot:1161963-Pelagomonas_calceolata.AAC.15
MAAVSKAVQHEETRDFLYNDQENLALTCLAMEVVGAKGRNLRSCLSNPSILTQTTERKMQDLDHDLTYPIRCLSGTDRAH